MAFIHSMPFMAENLTEWVDNVNRFRIDSLVKSDTLAKLISQVGSYKVNDVKLWDWHEVVSELMRLYTAIYFLILRILFYDCVQLKSILHFSL